MITKQLEASEWKKLNLRKATHAHITKETIFIVFQGKLQGVTVDYAVELPNDFIHIRLCQTLKEPVRTYMFNEGMVQRLKEVHTIQHYPRNSVSESALDDKGLVQDTVYCMTKKGHMSFSVVKCQVSGKSLSCADVYATK